MRFPWTKQSEKTSNLLAIVDQSQTKVSELEHELAVSRAELGQLQQTIERQGTLVSGMYEIIQKSAEAPPTYRWDNPWRYASPHSTKRKPEAIAPLELLRNFARTYDVLRSCINHLKREVRAVPFEIVSRDPDKKIPEERIKKAKEFFGRNGGLGGLHTRTRHFENAIFEDVMVIGAYAVFLWKKRNGTIHEAVALDASTIRPKVDVYGWQDPNEAFEQQILGVPYRTFGKDELLYDGLDPVTYSPYFVSPVEYLLGVIMSALSADNWNRSWLTDGNTPDALISVPETWTPEQVIAYQEYFDAILSGNASERRKTRIVPSGTKSVVSQTRHEADFQEFETWLMRRTCSIMGVAPASIGYAGDQYKESQGESMRSTSVFGAGALLELRKDLYDDLLEMNGFADLEIRDVMAREEDPTVKASRLVSETGGAFKTVNEARSEQGLDPIEGGDVIRGLTDSTEEDPDPFEPDEDETEEEDEQRLEDLGKWEKKALKRIKEGKPAQCEFRSDFLDETELRSIFEALGGCTAADEVATLFRYSKDQPRDPAGRWLKTGPLKEFVDRSLARRSGTTTYVIGTVGKTVGKRLEQLTGQNFVGWKVMLSESDIRHAWDRHGPGSKEAKNGGIPITHESLIKATDAIRNPDQAIYSPSPTDGQPSTLTISKGDRVKQVVSIHVASKRRNALVLKTIYNVRVSGAAHE